MLCMSDIMEEGNIIGWFKEEGEIVEVGEILVEVEIDKVMMELDSYFDGVLLYIVVKEGQVFINGVIVVIGEEGEDWKVVIEVVGIVLDNGLVEKENDVLVDEFVEEVSSIFEVVVLVLSVVSDEGRVKVFFLVCSMVKEVNIDFSMIFGLGDNGCIVKCDVEVVMVE